MDGCVCVCVLVGGDGGVCVLVVVMVVCVCWWVGVCLLSVLFISGVRPVKIPSKLLRLLFPVCCLLCPRPNSAPSFQATVLCLPAVC